MYPDSPCLVRENAAKSFALASALFPKEEWVLKEVNIWVAKSRLPEEYREKDKWEREITQVRILTNRGSVVYFLPEKKNEDKGKIYADAVINGEVTELKTVSGNRSTLGTDFRQGYKQGAALIKGRTEPQPNGGSREGSLLDMEKHSVYIRLLSDISPGSVKAKIAGELKNRPGRGHFICYFEVSGMLYYWTYEELRAIIGMGQKKITRPRLNGTGFGRPG
jgi:hypothetical protein